MVKKVYQANVEGKRGRGRPQRRWRDEVKDLLLGKGLNEREGMMLARDRDGWVTCYLSYLCSIIF